MSKHIAAIRGSKYLGFDVSENKLYLSTNYGITWGTGLSVPEITLVTFSHIFENGNILVCSLDAAYVSTDSLATYALCAVYDINGDAFVGTQQCFRSTRESYYNDVNGEILVWGCYSTIAPTWYSNINAWYTIDNGLTIKSFWKAGVSKIDNVVLSCKHCHGIDRCYADGSWWLTTGDGTNHVHTIKFFYDWDTDGWTGTKIAGDNLPSSTSNTSMCVWKCVGTYFYDGYVYWCTDTNPDDDFWGIWRCLIEEYGDKTKIEKLFTFTYEGWGIIGLGEKMLCIERSRAVSDKKVAITKNGIDWEYVYANGGTNFADAYLTFYCPRGPDDRGYFRIDQMSVGEDIQTFTGGETILIKIRD
jgi:hypothetical protein